MKPTMPDMILMLDGVEISNHRSEIEACQAAYEHGPGTYTLVRPDGEIVIYECAAEPEPEPAPEPEPDPEPEPEPNPEPTDPAGQYILDDSGAGPTQHVWSTHLGLRWRNNMGDWTDQHGTPQGVDAFARDTVAALGWIEFDITELARLEAKTSKGILISSTQNTGIPRFAGRANTDISRRPQLVVNGTAIPARAMTTISTSTTFPAGAVNPQVSRNTSALIQFNVPDETINTAILRLYVTSKSSGTNRISIYRLDPPAFTLGGNNVDPGSTDPDVVEQVDFSSFAGLGHIVEAKPNLLRGRFIPKTTSKDTRLSVSKQILTMQADLTDPLRPPANVEDELYCRMYILLEDDWTSTVDGNKGGIGWDLRMGWWNDHGGYWQSTTGNGGAPGTGLKLFAPAGSLGGSQTDDRWEYQGHSIRMEFGKGNAGCPYDRLRPLQSYVYNLDQNGGYGNMVRLGSGVVERGRKFCIEQRIRMNSITGPYDSRGNGTAVADGVLETWLNGEKISSRTNFRWRRHPEMGVQAMWINWFYGGKFATETEMHYQVSDCVIARNYIGPL